MFEIWTRWPNQHEFLKRSLINQIEWKNKCVFFNCNFLGFKSIIKSVLGTFNFFNLHRFEIWTPSKILQDPKKLNKRHLKLFENLIFSHPLIMQILELISKKSKENAEENSIIVRFPFSIFFFFQIHSFSERWIEQSFLLWFF